MYPNLDKAVLFPRNQAICMKNWKLWRAPTVTKFNIILLTFCTRFLLSNVFKGVLLFINKNVKNECVETRSFLIFANDSRSKQNKKNTEHSFVDISMQKTCAKFQQEILNPMVVGTRQRFQFFRQKAWFLANNRALSKFQYEVSNYLISIIKS